jgi:hypothetical protein
MDLLVIDGVYQGYMLYLGYNSPEYTDLLGFGDNAQ